MLDEISLGSSQSAAEMVEVYAMALLRPLQLGNYDPADPDVQLAVQTLNWFGADFVWGYDQNHKPITAATIPVTAQNIFRGGTIGDQTGDYLSVFLTLDRSPLFPSGCSPDVADLIGAGQFATALGEPLLVPQGPVEYFGQKLSEFTAIQNAGVPKAYRAGFFNGRRKIITGIDLGNYVHVDNAYEEYIRAADILVSNQIPRSQTSPYSNGNPDYKNEGDGPCFGPPDIWSLIGAVRGLADRASFAQKWLVARRARPEAMAGLIHLAWFEGNAQLQTLLPKFNESQTQTFLARVAAVNQDQANESSYLLSQMYPEGSPAHPAWPSDHATIAGACVTVIKALFDDCYQWTLRDGRKVIVGQELDKLASNIAIGRDFAGVHYRKDGEHGILLGEEVAIRFLQDHSRIYWERYHNDWHGFTLTKRNGQRIRITPERIHLEDPCPVAAAMEVKAFRLLAPEAAEVYPKENL